MKTFFLFSFFISLHAHAIPIEEKKRVCQDLSGKVLATQRKKALDRCLDFVSLECDRIERMYRESCGENSPSENAVKYDIERGTKRFCDAALMKRETHRTLCDGLRRECRENKLALLDTSVEVNCTLFRDDQDKRICAMIEAAADRIIASEKSEKQKCANLPNSAK